MSNAIEWGLVLGVAAAWLCHRAVRAVRRLVPAGAGVAALRALGALLALGLAWASIIALFAILGA